MINLLFISDSPRTELLRGHFQQLLKLRIEVVEDFDRGLKDVFEKRPVAVCIQDQISGVTGESVARHIQLLLGNSAPGFILLHDASAKAKAIPGLFNHLVDLSAPFEEICKTLQLALQAQLADHWDKIYTPPVQKETTESDKAVTASLADQLIDEFVSENSIFNTQYTPSHPDLKSSAAAETIFLQELPGGPPAEPESARQRSEAAPASFDGVVPTVSPVPLPQPAIEAKTPPPQTVTPKPELTLQKEQQTPATEPAAEKKSDAGNETSVPVDELLQAFEENYRSSKRMKLRIVSGLLILLAVSLLVWMAQQRFFKKPGQASPKQQSVVPSAPKQTAVQPVASSAKAALSPVQPVKPKADALPSFIPKSGHDPAFSSSKPGWSRYLSNQRDYRLFQAEGRLKALQVLVVGSGSIDTAELKQILQELTGSDQYRTDSNAKRGKLLLEYATAAKHAELLIYRASSKGPIKALVLQLTP